MSGALATAPLSTKVSEVEKARFLETCDDIGTSPSNALRMFVSAFNKRGGFPFDPSNPYGFSRETVEAMEDAANGRTIGPFSSNEEMWVALLDDSE